MVNLNDNNHFNIPHADSLYCSVWKYGPHHSALEIRVHDSNVESDKTLFWLSFVTPIYFKCPMHWKSAAFRIGTTEEQESVLRLLTHGSSKADYMKEYQLFIVDINLPLLRPQAVQILALMGKAYQEGGLV